MVRIGGPVEIGLVTVNAGGGRSCKTGLVAFQAVDGQVGPCQWEIRGIVIKDQISISRRVTGQTSRIRIDVTANANMRIIGLGIQVTNYTTELCEISRGGVAVNTIHPFPLVLPAVDREILAIMVKGRWHPGIFSMTGRTVGREKIAAVIRVIGPIIIRLVASDTGVRCVVIISVMAAGAICCNGRVRSVQLVIIVVIVKPRWCPPGIGSVATDAVIGEVQFLVIRILCPVEIVLVTGHTFCGCPCKTVLMALQTACAQVRPGQWECSCIVVEDDISISGRVTGQAESIRIHITADAYVRIIGFRIQVTYHAAELGEITRCRMAIYTCGPFPLVLPAVDREILPVMVKSRWDPCVLCMAISTLDGELVAAVIRINRAVVIFNMAPGTGVWRIVVVAVMTLGAFHGYGGVRPSEFVKIIVDVKRGRSPSRISGMALRTVRREIQRSVVRIGGAIHIGFVAGDTIR